MQLTSIKLRKPQLVSHPKKISSKSVISTDINDILITLKQQEHDLSPKEASKLTLKQKSELYCSIIEQCYKNKANQILLCSVLGVPFLSGPVTLNSLSHLLAYRNSLNDQNQTHQINGQQSQARKSQRINKQLMPLYKYLQRIKQKGQYYFWMIFQDQQLGIFNVKLFTKSQFIEVKEASQSKKKRNVLLNKKNQGNASSSSLKINQEKQIDTIDENLINWDQVLVGIFISDFSKLQDSKERVMSMVGLASTASNSVGLSNKNTKQSFNKTHNKQAYVGKQKSISNYQPKINMTQCFNKKKLGEYQLSKHLKSTTPKDSSQEYSFHKTNKTTYIVSEHPKAQDEDPSKSKLASHLFHKQKTKITTLKKQLP